MNRNRLAAILDRVAGNSQVNQLETIAEQWLENSRMRVKESSYIKYRNLLQNHILPCMGKTDVAELTTEYIGNFIRQKISEGRRDGTGGLSEKSVKDMITVLRTICSYAGRQGIEALCHLNC